MISSFGKINKPTVGTEWGPRAERAGVSGPLAVDGRDVTTFVSNGRDFLHADEGYSWRWAAHPPQYPALVLKRKPTN